MIRSLFIILSLVAGAARATPLKLDPEASKVSFTAVGKPGFLRINGEGAKVDGTADKAATGGLEGVFEVKIDEFVTGIDLRDEHMKKTYLETAKFPTARLKWAVAGPSVKGEVPFKGTLTLHGVEKAIEGTATVSPDAAAKKALVDAAFTVKLSDFAIQIPKYLGVTVAEDVSVKALLTVLGDVAALGH